MISGLIFVRFDKKTEFAENVKSQLKTQKLDLKMLKTQLRNLKTPVYCIADFTPVRSLDGLKLQSSIGILQNMGIHSKIR